MTDTIAVIVGEWQPIETAPYNTMILVFMNGDQFVAWFQDDASDPHYELGWESELNRTWCVTDNKLGPFALRGGKPTHWMPLPAAPTGVSDDD